MAARLHRIRSHGWPYLVATDGERVVGFAYAAAFRERAAFRFTLEDSVYVDAAARGRGVGRALLASVIAEASALGYRQMLAVVGDSGNAASLSLHEKLGFFRCGVLASVGWKAGRWLDAVLLQRPLGDGDRRQPETT